MSSRYVENQYVCDCLIQKAYESTIGKIGAIYKIRCGLLKECHGLKGKKVEFKEYIDGVAMNYEERMQHYKDLWVENNANLVEGYLRQMVLVTKILETIDKTSTEDQVLERILLKETESLRIFSEVEELSYKFIERYKTKEKEESDR